MNPIALLLFMLLALSAVIVAAVFILLAPIFRQQGGGRTLHFVNGVCLENGDGIWRLLKYMGLRRELGKQLWPPGHDRTLTAEAGAYRPPRADIYYWLNLPVWERRRRSHDSSPTDYSFRYAVVSLLLAVLSLLLAVVSLFTDPPAGKPLE